MFPILSTKVCFSSGSKHGRVNQNDAYFCLNFVLEPNFLEICFSILSRTLYCIASKRTRYRSTRSENPYRVERDMDF